MPLPNSAPKLKRPAVKDEVYAALLEWIVDGTLGPGERVRDKELAEALGVSRTPVREALQRLEDAGLVETSASRWTRVASLDVAQAEQVYPVVWSLEALAVELAGRDLSDEDLREMEEANARLSRALETGDALGASRADRDFHEVLVRRGQNRELAKMVEDLKIKIRRLEIAYFGGCALAERSVAEHRLIMEALKSGDSERTAEGVRENWEASLRRFCRQADGTASSSEEP
jgi:DNA-binding GntR family transcriptional regulator